jgi:hypothetical protein
MLRKEFMQMLHDRVTLAMMAAIPLTQLVLFGHALACKIFLILMAQSWLRGIQAERITLACSRSFPF